ncbi:MAG: hypothetical protein CMJ19_07575 [Phycisphaeraceae bacterium]|nr:hypothetical protein [Phycisphaeraceae bacterium]
MQTVWGQTKTVNLDELDIASKYKTSELRYKVSKAMPNAPVEELLLKTSVLKKQVLLTDQLRRNGKLRFTSTVKCQRDAYLNPVVIQFNKGKEHATVRLQKGKALINLMGFDLAPKDVPSKFMTLMGLYRILPLLPQNQGAIVQFDAFTSIKDFNPTKPDKPYTITCTGKQQITFNGEKIDCIGFDIDCDTKIQAWVQDDQLLRVREASGTQTDLMLDK